MSKITIFAIAAVVIAAALPTTAQTFQDDVIAEEMKAESKPIWDWMKTSFQFRGDGVNFAQIAGNRRVQVNEELVRLGLVQRVYVQDEKNRLAAQKYEREQVACEKRKKETHKIIFCETTPDSWMRNGGWRATYKYPEDWTENGEDIVANGDDNAVRVKFGNARTVRILNLRSANEAECEIWVRKRVWLDNPTIPAVVAMQVSGQDYLEFDTCWALGEKGPVARFSSMVLD